MMRLHNRWLLLVAFAAGLITATCFPHPFTVVVVAAVLILAGLCLCRYC